MNDLERRVAKLEVQETSPAGRYDDLLGPITSSRVGANNKPDFDATNVGYLFPQNDTGEVLYMVFQMPHAWKEESTVYPHVHFLQTGSSMPVFKISYAWHSIGGTVPAFATLTMSTAAVSYTSGSIHQIATNTSGISGSGKTISSLLLCKLYRDDNIVSGDVLVWAMDVHYLRDSHGSKQEYVK